MYHNSVYFNNLKIMLFVIRHLFFSFFFFLRMFAEKIKLLVSDWKSDFLSKYTERISKKGKKLTKRKILVSFVKFKRKIFKEDISWKIFLSAFRNFSLFVLVLQRFSYRIFILCVRNILLFEKHWMLLKRKLFNC